MSVLNKLAYALNRRDEVPNQELADAIVKKKDRKGVEELVLNLGNKNKSIQSDCIKTLYEIGERDPGLLSGQIKAFVTLLDHSNNRMVWGGMSALARIAPTDPSGIYKHLAKIMEAADKGSVITKDNAVRILITLADDKRYSEEALSFLLDQLRNCPTNQLPMYAESAIDVMRLKYKDDFIRVLTKRIPEIEKETKQKRVENVIKKLKK